MRVALVQLNSTRDIDDNLDRCRRYARQAIDGGADWILYPENAPFLGRDDEKIPIAETIDGSIVGEFRAIADDHDAWVTLGSFPEKSPDPERTFNTQVHIGPDGLVADAYRKIHLFDVSIDDDNQYRESESVHPGTEIVSTRVTASGDDHRVGLSICYDLRFPELYRVLHSREVEAITVPSAFTFETGSAHWHALLQARAIENQAYVLAPNQCGRHFGTRRSFGQSALYDPWGRLVASAGDREGVIVADIDFDYVTEIRRSVPVLEHRRIERVDASD